MRFCRKKSTSGRPTYRPETEHVVNGAVKLGEFPIEHVGSLGRGEPPERDERPPLYFSAPLATKGRCMLEVVPVNAFKDNYVWTLRNRTHAAVIDPGEAQPVLEYLEAEKLVLAAILATHHHPDHVGGIAQLLQRSRVPVYGPKHEPIATLSHPVAEGDKVSVP